jgi:hypothetical protein
MVRKIHSVSGAYIKAHSKVWKGLPQVCMGGDNPPKRLSIARSNKQTMILGVNTKIAWAQ